MIDTQYPCIPVWVIGYQLPRKHHNISTSSGVDGVVLAPKVIGSVIYLHGVDRVYRIVRNDYCIVFFGCECMITMGDV
jgi:hypothetical protein